MKKVTILFFYFLSPLLPIITNYSYHPSYYNDINNLISMIAGSCAYTWLITEFVIIARPKFVEVNFGLDKFYRFHGIMAVVSIGLVFIHKNFKWENDNGDMALNIFIFVSIMALFFMTNAISKYIKPLGDLKRKLFKLYITKYEFQVAIHNLTIIALIFMFVHVFLTSSAESNIQLQMVYIAFFTISLGCYIYHKFIKRLFLIDKYNVNGIKNENSNTLTVSLSPFDSKDVFNYKPGQFAFIRIYGENANAEEHPFTISSNPDDRKNLTFTIKQIGDFTSSLKNITNKNIAKIDGPYGRMSYVNYPNEKNLVFIIGGIGITPALSMIRHLEKRTPEKKVILLWGIRTANDLICQNELLEISKNMSNFIFSPIAFKDESWKGEKGIINQERIQNTIKSNSLDINITGFYICGPEIMMDIAVKSLKNIGVKSSNIHFEKFSL